MSKFPPLKYNWALVGLLLSMLLFAIFCTNDSPVEEETKVEKPKPKARVSVPRFVADSAYQYVARQVDFGHRVPNSEAHRQCRDWLISQFKGFDAKVIAQDFQAQAYTGVTLNGTNIIAQYNPDHKDRVVLAAHWDTRHIADYDPDPANQDKPILGADDGGSGVGVLLEIARQIQQNPIDLGVDIVLFDLEDHGEGGGEGDPRSWCLGSQHWSKNPHVPGYRAKFGILLDMVGAKNARFGKDGTSMQYAPQIMNKVWKLANGMGYGAFFVNERDRAIIDDHYFVNQMTSIPMIDIINRRTDTETGFGHYWHTQKDNMSVIDRRPLRAVGQTVLAVIYKTSDGSF
ncbi:MAG: M28 family peptidase [Bacteroidota bacterium]